ncbi:hypothetical protein K4K52_006965 [Colletotrichum sp. SAR 10_76]|nr:hypothetical protein K4K51_000621 [Colletotrichum sp. SAR 10_75]KAI8212819.1 hypothetical protein K4K52_006965 [Colletotrichum sp. SAR 10_76]
MAVPNWLRIVFLLLTFASFLPQLQRLWSRRDSSGVSLYYVLFNLLVATELLTIDLTLLTGVEDSDVFVQQPASLGDWLNLAQFAIVWALWALILVSCIVFYPSDEPRGVPAKVSAIYTTYLLISLVPVIIVTASPSSREGRRWFDALFLGFHTYFLNPIIIIFGIAALYAEARTIRARPEGSGLGSLSVVGLAAQAVVFFIVGVAWPGRLVWPFPIFGRGFLAWIQMIGFVLIDYIIFVIAQADLLYIAMQHNGWHAEVQGANGEREPLI